MLTRAWPWDLESHGAQAIMEAHLNREPIPPSQRVGWIPKSVDDCVLQALGKNAARRQQDVLEFHRGLGELPFVDDGSGHHRSEGITAPTAETLAHGRGGPRGLGDRNTLPDAEAFSPASVYVSARLEDTWSEQGASAPSSVAGAVASTLGPAAQAADASSLGAHADHLDTPLSSASEPGARARRSASPPRARRMSFPSTHAPEVQRGRVRSALQRLGASLRLCGGLSRDRDHRAGEARRQALHSRPAHHRVRRARRPSRVGHVRRGDTRRTSRTSRPMTFALASRSSCGSGAAPLVRPGGLKLLFDQNLAPRLVARLADAFPGSEHARNVGLAAADDRALWEYAKAGGFAILSKDADFRQLSFLYGTPPKVIWLRVERLIDGGNRCHRAGSGERFGSVRRRSGGFDASCHLVIAFLAWCPGAVSPGLRSRRPWRIGGRSGLARAWRRLTCAAFATYCRRWSASSVRGQRKRLA